MQLISEQSISAETLKMSPCKIHSAAHSPRRHHESMRNLFNIEARGPDYDVKNENLDSI